MALFTTDLHHPLYYWCLPQAALYIPSVKNLVHSANMTRTNKNNLPLSPYTGMDPVLTMLEKLGLHLLEVVRKVIHRFMSVAELLNSKVFPLCTGETVAMRGESKKKIVGLEAPEESPGWEARNMALVPTVVDKKTLDPQMKIMEEPDEIAVNGDEVVLSDWLEWEFEEEEEEGNGDEDELDDDDDEEEEGEDKEESPEDEENETEWSDEEDSDWSDDEGDSEASKESAELWESFLNNSDPYNPLYFCPTGVKSKSTDKTQKCTTSRPPVSKKSKSAEEHSPEKSTKEGSKKVRFSEEVKVHHLVAWSFASRAARDGSCWMELARDRERFRRRVERTGEVLSPCLTAQHRARVWDRPQRGAHS